MSFESEVADLARAIDANATEASRLRSAVIARADALTASFQSVSEELIASLADKMPAVGGSLTRGSIEATPIGGLSPAPGTFTTLVTTDTPGSFWADDPTPVRVNKIGDRFFAGAAIKHTGRRTGPLGGDWLTENAANYFIKNCQAAVLGTDRAGLLVGAYTAPGEPSRLNSGLMAVTVNKGLNSFGRGIYAEMFHMSSGGGSCAAEFQGGNYTGVRPVTSPYGASGVSILYLGVESGHNYVTGDKNTPLPPPTQPVAHFMDFSGGSINAPYQKALFGLLFRNGSLYRGVDGLTGSAVAIAMARQHELRWFASATLPGAVIRSDVSAVAGQDTGLIFNNTSIKLAGSAERSIAVLKDDISGDGAVNWLLLSNARTNVFPIIAAQGSDPNVGLELRGKALGGIRMTSHDGAGENFRVTPPTDAPVNYMTVTGGALGQPVTFGAAGASASTDIRILPKGPNSYVRFGKFEALTTPMNVVGFINIRADNGTIMPLAVLGPPV